MLNADWKQHFTNTTAMLKYAQRIFLKHQNLLKNYTYLSVLQFYSLLIPLITYPHLIRVLEKDLYGLVIFAQTICAFFSIIIDFGFNITATKHVSIKRNNKKDLSELIVSVYAIKIILALFSAIVLIVLLFTIPELSKNKLIYIISFTVCINDIFFCQWFFQGIEQMKHITKISIFSKTIFAALIFIFIGDKSDYLLVPLFAGFAASINAIASIFIVFRVKKIAFSRPSFKTIFFYFQDAKPIFLSRLISKTKDQSSTVFIGTSIGMIEVAYYDLVIKMVNIANYFLEMITITVFPALSKTKNSYATRILFKVTVFFSIIFYTLFFFIGEPIVVFIGGEKMKNAALLFPIVGFFLFRSSSYFIGNAILIVNNKTKPFIKSLLVSGISYFLVISFIYVMKVKIYLELLIIVSLISLFVEIFYRLYACKKNNLLDRLIKA